MTREAIAMPYFEPRNMTLAVSGHQWLWCCLLCLSLNSAVVTAQVVQWTEIPSTVPKTPQAKAFHASVSLDYGNCDTTSWNGTAVLVFGGQEFFSTTAVIFKDLWLFNSSTMQWTEIDPVPPLMETPYARYGHSMNVVMNDGCPEYVIVHGGGIQGGGAPWSDEAISVVLVDDTWVLSNLLPPLSSAHWTRLGQFHNESSWIAPTPRIGHTAAVLYDVNIMNSTNPVMIVTGGFGYDQSNCSNPKAPCSILDPLSMMEVWTLDMDGNEFQYWEWKRMDAKYTNESCIPSDRGFVIHQAIGTDERQTELFVTGGWDGTSNFRDTFAYFLSLQKGDPVWYCTNTSNELSGTFAMSDALFVREETTIYLFGGSRFPRQDMFWPAGDSFFESWSHEIFRSRGAATAAIAKVIIYSPTNVTVTSLLSEDSGVNLAKIGQGPYGRVGQSVSRMGNTALLFGGQAPYSTYYFNSTWFVQFGSDSGLSSIVDWDVLHPEDSLDAPLALHSGAAVATSFSLTTFGALWHIGGATLTYDPSGSLWMYKLSGLIPEYNDGSEFRWTRRSLQYEGIWDPTAVHDRVVLNTSEVYQPMQFHTAVTINNSQVLVFGGRISTEAGAYSTATRMLWLNLSHNAGDFSLDTPIAWADVLRSKGVPWPPSRSCHAAAALSEGYGGFTTTSGMIISGGVNFTCGTTCDCSGQILDDVWLYNTNTGKWTELPALPQPLYGHITSVLSVGEKKLVYVYGGSRSAVFDKCINNVGSPWVRPTTVLSSLYALDITDIKQVGSWQTLNIPGPGPIFFPIGASSESKIIFYGGSTCSSNDRHANGTVCQLSHGDALVTQALQDTWYFEATSISSGMWQKIALKNDSFVPDRIGSSIALFQEGSQLLGQTETSKLLLYGGVRIERTLTGHRMNFDLGDDVPPIAMLTLGCNEGYSSADFSNLPCVQCRPGTFATQGQSNCTACPRGTTTLAPGSVAAAFCNVCEIGWCHGHGKCSVVSGRPTCECDFMFDDSGRCEAVQNLVLVVLLGFIILVGCTFVVYWRRQKKQRNKLVIRNQIYEDTLQERNDELLQLQSVWKIDRNSLELGKKIAEGSYGEVFQGMYGSFPCAVKMVRKELRDFDFNQHAREFEREIELLQGLRDTNIVFFFGWGIWFDQQTFFVTELCSRGSLRAVLDNPDPDCDISVKLGVKIAHDAAKGMRFLHNLDPPRLHRDIKADNVLITDDWTAKITDFGSARIFGNAEETSDQWVMLQKKKVRFATSVTGHGTPLQDFARPSPAPTSYIALNDSIVDSEDDDDAILGNSEGAGAVMMSADVGTLLWEAPEVMSKPGGRGQPTTIYNTSADVYSYAITMYEILSKELPYTNIPNVDLAKLGMFKFKAEIQKGLRPRIENNNGYPHFYVELMVSAWSSDPLDRPSFDEIVEQFSSDGLPFPSASQTYR